MVFITSGRLTLTGYGQEIEHYNGCCLGKELLKWALRPSEVLPNTNRTVKMIIDVQAFALGAD